MHILPTQLFTVSRARISRLGGCTEAPQSTKAPSGPNGTPCESFFTSAWELNLWSIRTFTNHGGSEVGADVSEEWKSWKWLVCTQDSSVPHFGISAGGSTSSKQCLQLQFLPRGQSWNLLAEAILGQSEMSPFEVTRPSWSWDLDAALRQQPTSLYQQSAVHFSRCPKNCSSFCFQEFWEGLSEWCWVSASGQWNMFEVKLRVSRTLFYVPKKQQLHVMLISQNHSRNCFQPLTFFELTRSVDLLVNNETLRSFDGIFRHRNIVFLSSLIFFTLFLIP